MSEIVEKWKKSLLNLGRRNKLINFKETRRTTLKLTTPGIDELYIRLVVNNDTLDFPILRFKSLIELEENGEDENEDVKEEVIPGDIETEKKIKELILTLKSLRTKAKSSIEELGVNTLYLVLGTLKWTEIEHSNVENVSPLILIPVTLTVKSVGDPYQLSLLEDDIVLNPTLRAKLETEFNIVLPEFEFQEDGVISFLQKLKRSFSLYPDWKIQEDVYLAFLSFLKINMYNDLKEHEQKLLNHPIISSLMTKQPFCSFAESQNLFGENFHPDSIPPEETFQVVNADSSQQQAIQISKKGESFVMQGPPGTGKSQTITNIIAETLAQGKKVLFVSEKLAALQVVYKRLTEAGLSDFCLPLHDPKVNKKEILQMLNQTLNLSKCRLKEEAMGKLDRLQRIREHLNEYYKELHEFIEPLHRTFYQVFGLCEELAAYPDVIFEIKDISTATLHSEGEKINILQNYVRIVGNDVEAFTQSPWFGAVIERITHSLNTEINEKIGYLLPVIRVIQQQLEELYQVLGWKEEVKLAKSHDLDKLFQLIREAVPFHIDWIEKFSVTQLIAFQNRFKEYQHLSEWKQEIDEVFQALVYELPTLELKNKTQALFTSLSDFGIVINKKEVSQHVKDWETYLSNVIELGVLINESTLFTEYGIHKPENFQQLSYTIEILQLLRTGLCPLESWFEAENRNKVIFYCKQLQELWEHAQKLKASVLASFDEGILTINYESLIKDFRTKYDSRIKRFFSLAFRKDKKLFKRYRNSATFTLEYDTLLYLLCIIQELKKTEQEISLKEIEAAPFLGDKYKGAQTRWEEIEFELKQFYNFLSLNAIQGGISETFRQALLQKRVHIDSVNLFLDRINKFVLEDTIRFMQTGSLMDCSDLNKITFTDIIQKIEQVHPMLIELSQAFMVINKSLRNPVEDFEYVNEKLYLVNQYKQLRETIQAQEDILKTSFGDYYGGVDTNWLILDEKLEKVIQLLKVREVYHIPQSFYRKLVTEASTVISLYEQLKDAQLSAAPHYLYFKELFDESVDFDNEPLEKLQLRLTDCLNQKQPLEAWIDYRNCKKQIQKFHLEEFIEQIESRFRDLQLDMKDLVSVYKKCFYKLWIDYFIIQKPAIQEFRSNYFEPETREFVRLDESQMNISRQRIKVSLTNNIPSMTSFTSARDEMGILNRELNKQRKIMPTRKLFKAIPNLLLRLKPCMMMSPLSVSIFLDSNIYDFDLVIFDEASQVRTEDAVGAIMRGKQLIVTGDNRQLPPSNFFNSSDFSDGYDSDDEDDDYGSFESVLDEALNIMPAVWLKWHYRSRHEDLIAFSNYKIYDRKLITFPSNQERGKDRGVEYIYVKDGIYDRTRKRNNPEEAKKVADLVFQHFKERPDYSLGVVTFSESQKDAIEIEIDKRRYQNPYFENFFSEDNANPFFVKNLENVQGDERDTIIFSIGYAKDKNGSMSMNFGPLNRMGGERRLNVAITRAKYNVKLVGSIMPTDIDLSRTSAEGAKLLRSYMEFALNGPRVLIGEAKEDIEAETESPFEESVYRFLLSKGYQVAKQVGCSTYRIDLAIKHPDLRGVYVLGIECDGATYHSSKCARERDRLRQYVLEEMGWKIYRIWSTDWNKDPYTQKNKLVNFIEKVIGDYNETECDRVEHRDLETNDLIEAVECSENSETLDFGFVPYESKNCSMDDFICIYRYDRCALIKDIIKFEQPLHFKVLCRRLFGLLRTSRITERVQANVMSYIGKDKDQLDFKYGEHPYDSFLSFKDFEVNVFRIPEKGVVREIEEISPEEIHVAMKAIVQRSFGLTKEGLFSIIASHLGFSKVGPRMKMYLEQVYQLALSKSLLKEYEGGKLTLISDN